MIIGILYFNKSENDFKVYYYMGESDVWNRKILDDYLDMWLSELERIRLEIKRESIENDLALQVHISGGYMPIGIENLSIRKFAKQMNCTVMCDIPFPP